MEGVRGFINPLLETLGTYLPNVAGAVIILALGWLFALVISKGLQKVLGLIKLDERLKGEGEEPKKLEAFFARLVYYILLLCVFLLVLDILGVEGVLDPVRNMLDKILAMLPHVLAALLIGVLGFIIARMVASLVEAVTKGVDLLNPKLGLSEDFKLSRLLGQLVFIFIFVPILIAALDALKIEAISAPATGMLQTIMLTIPKILGAAIILAVAFFLGRLAARIVTDLTKNVGGDMVPDKIGIGALFSQKLTLSKVCGGLVLFFVMIGATISATERLEMPQIANILSDLLVFAGEVALGLIILAIGNLIATIAYKALSHGEHTRVVASVARFAILALVLAMGLRAMGIADDIIRLAFGLSLGAVAVAFALSFGLGGREAAGKQMEHWLGKLRPRE